MMKVTRLAIGVVLVLGLFVSLPTSPVAAASCGVWRWPVKTLSDNDRHEVRFRPLDTSVRGFRARSRPKVRFGRNGGRTGHVEFHTWRLRARPLQARLEGDGDIHLVIAAPRKPAKTMIVEFPDRSCVASAFKRPQIARARRRFLNNCGRVSASRWSHLRGVVTIVGVGFWDAIHGQTGVAPNGIELHPVLGFSGSCRRRTP